MIKVELHYAWLPTPDQEVSLGPMFFRVLSSIHETGSLAATARNMGKSYRHIWGLMGKWEETFGRPLVDLQRGRGARLSEFGLKLLWAEELVRARLTPGLENVRHEIEQALAQATEVQPARISVCASHDMALAALRDRMAQRKGLKLDIRFMASLESLESFAHGRCALAGFHVAEGVDDSTTSGFRRHLSNSKHRVIGVATRTQGLILKGGNPKGIRNLADLTRDAIRFVNRQRGSGSRIEFDHLLAGAGVSASKIDGYQHEEFTHLAVAAIIASGTADAGFGIKAAAAQYELDFIPLLTERYCLACRSDAVVGAEITELIALLRGQEFREVLAALPGYGNAISGQLFGPDEMFPR